MKLMIDTHVIFWWFAAPSKIRKKHLESIATPENEICISMISVFELYLKASLRKILLPANFPSVLEEADFSFISIQMSHLETFRQLPVHHRDPFDRLIIAQAIAEQLPLISYDRHFSKYPIQLL